MTFKNEFYNKGNNNNFVIPEDWIYRGEGNCNVVLSLPKHRKILRVRKSERPKSLIRWIFVLISEFLYWYCGRGYKDESRDINFYLTVMRSLVGINYTSDVSQVFLTRNQINMFREGLSKLRPEYRQDKTLQYGRSAVFEDFAFLPKEITSNQNLCLSSDIFSVEIKPKQGFRCAEEKLWPECVFCMHQFLKVEKGRVNKLTKYCPEDLFSGDKTRMKIALKHLCEVPQNNLKIFKNGRLYYGEKTKENSFGHNVLRDIFEEYQDSEISLEEEFFTFLQGCLTKDLANNTTDRSLKLWCDCSQNLDQTGSKLPKNSVLSNILAVQMLNKEGTEEVYRKLPKESTYCALENWSFVNKLIDRVKNRKNKCVKCVIESCGNDEGDTRFAPYLISAIAKDCSLMVTFCKVNYINNKDLNLSNVFETKYGDFIVNVGVFDLYPKPISTIQKHYKRNREILKVYKNMKGEC